MFKRRSPCVEYVQISYTEISMGIHSLMALRTLAIQILHAGGRARDASVFAQSVTLAFVRERGEEMFGINVYLGRGFGRL